MKFFILLLLLLWLFALDIKRTPFYSEAYHNRSERQSKKIDHATKTMMASGLNQFYTSLAKHQQKYHSRATPYLEQNEEDTFQVLTMEQLRRSMMFIIGLWALALIIFIAERALTKWEHWRSCRVQYLNRNHTHGFTFQRINQLIRRTLRNFPKTPGKSNKAQKTNTKTTKWISIQIGLLQIRILYHFWSAFQICEHCFFAPDFGSFSTF